MNVFEQMAASQPAGASPAAPAGDAAPVFQQMAARPPVAPAFAQMAAQSEIDRTPGLDAKGRAALTEKHVGATIGLPPAYTPPPAPTLGQTTMAGVLNAVRGIPGIGETLVKHEFRPEDFPVDRNALPRMVPGVGALIPSDIAQPGDAPGLTQQIDNAIAGGAAGAAAGMLRAASNLPGGPDDPQQFQEAMGAYQQTFPHPHTWPFKVLGGVGSAGMMIPAMPLGGAGMFAAGATSGFGGGQMELDRREAAGEQVSAAAKVGVPLAYGVGEGITELIGGKVATTLAPGLMRMVPGGIIPKVAAATGINVAGNVGEEVAAEVFQNMAQRAAVSSGAITAGPSGVAPRQPNIFDGMADAALGGLGGGLALAPVSVGVAAQQQQQAARATQDVSAVSEPQTPVTPPPYAGIAAQPPSPPLTPDVAQPTPVSAPTPATPPAASQTPPADAAQENGPAPSVSTGGSSKVGQSTPGVPVAGAGESVATAAPPVKQKRAKTPFTKSAVEKKLLAYHEGPGGGYTAADEAELSDVFNPFTFHNALPGEVKRHIENNPASRRLFRVTGDPTAAGGADAFGKLGDRYWQIVDKIAGNDVNAAKESARKSGGPRMAFWAAVHDHLPESRYTTDPQTGTRKLKFDDRKDQIGVDPATLNVGQVFELNAEKFQVVEDEDGYRVLKDGAEYPETPVEALAGEKIPVDKGTLQAAPEAELPEGGAFDDLGPSPLPSPLSTGERQATPKPQFFDADAAGVTPREQGVFGQEVLDKATGSKTGGLFHQPNDAAPVEGDRVKASRNAVDPKNTGNIFDQMARDAKAGGTGPLASPARDVAERGIEELDAKVVPPTRPRVKVSPLPGGNAKKLADIQLDLQKALGRQVRTGKSSPRSAGTYYPGSSKTVVRFAGDLDTTAHEVAHALDDEFSLVGAWAGNRQRSPFDAELIPNFSGYGSVTKGGARSKLAYQRAEGVAEWVRAYLVNPAAAAAAAPKFYQHFQNTVPGRVRSALNGFGNDVRRWAGSSATEKTLANINTRDREPALLTRLVSFFRGERKSSFETTGLQMQAAKWTDSMGPLIKAVRRAKTIRGDFDPGDVLRDPEILVRTVEGYGGKLEDIHDHGMVKAHSTDPKTPFQRAPGVDGGDRWLLGADIIDSTSPETITRDWDDGIAYLISQSAIERAANILNDAQAEAAAASDPKLAARILNAATNKVHRHLTGTGAGIDSDLRVAQGTLAEIAADPKRLAKAKELARRYRAWADANLRYWVDKGRMSQARYDAIVKRNQHYASMQRLVETVSPDVRPQTSKRLASVRDVVKRFKGGNRMIDNPFVSLLSQTDAMVREADRNAVLDAFTDLLTTERTMYDGDVQDLDAIGSRAKAGDPDTIRVFKKGEEQHWQFERGVNYALKNWGDLNDSSGVLGILQGLARMTRAGVVYSPPYYVRNFLRDVQHRTIVSERGGNPLDLLKPSSYTNLSDFKQAGGDQAAALMAANREDYRRGMRQVMRDMTKDPRFVLAVPQKLWNGWRGIGRVSELANRLPEYNRVYRQELAKGRTAEEAATLAAYQARGLLDFARGGVYAKKINRFVPFFNASIQGILRGGRAVNPLPEGIRGPLHIRGPARSATAFALMVMLPRVIMRATQGDDEEEYKQLPPYVRDYFLNFKIGPNKWLSIPQPHEFAVLSAFFERLYDRTKGDKNAFEWHGWNWLKAMTPAELSDLAGPLSAMLEVSANYDFFRDTPIVPPHEAKLDVELREGTDRASRLGQAIQKIIGADARMIDHFVYGQFGPAGGMAMDASNVGRADKIPGASLRSLTGVLRQRPTYQSLDVKAVLKLSSSLGIEGRKDIKDFRADVREAARATTDDERDRLMDAVDAEAKKLREKLEADHDRLLEERKRKAIDKKAAAKR